MESAPSGFSSRVEISLCLMQVDGNKITTFSGVKSAEFLRDFPINPPASNTIPIPQGNLMGVIWEGSHYWGSLKFPLNLQKPPPSFSLHESFRIQKPAISSKKINVTLIRGSPTTKPKTSFMSQENKCNHHLAAPFLWLSYNPSYGKSLGKPITLDRRVQRVDQGCRNIISTFAP